MNCNNLQNNYVLRVLFVLCFGGEGDWLGARGGGRNISSPLRRRFKYFPMLFFWGEGVPNFMVVF